MTSSNDQAAHLPRPNVVFIVGDNVGWGDIGCYGGSAPTPRIDALASEGIRFKNYNVEAQCTPTRSAILTGRLPIRTGNCSVPLPGQGDYGLPRGNTRWGSCSRMRATPPRHSANGMSVTSKAGCPPTRASTSGLGSRTHLTRPATAPTRCSPNPVGRRRRSGRA